MKKIQASSAMAGLVGKTPLVEIPTRTTNPDVRLFAKLEGNNPASSVKDRAASSMIRRAEERGDLKPGMTLIEPTSGNTGIALAMIAASRGYPIELVMPANSTAERVRTMRAFGAKVILTPGERTIEGSIDFARERAKQPGYCMLDQFANPDNPLAHYETTGPEIWDDTAGQITHFVSAMGTTGTIMGVSRFLKEQNPEVTIVGCQPTAGSRIPGIRRWPKEYLPKFFEPERVDRTIDVSQSDAEVQARWLAAEYGLFCGISAAGATLVAQQICAELESGIVVTIICDRGDRYLSSPVFETAGELEMIEHLD
ncbi:MAG: cysteine synthase B [Mariniblastus sp.]|jgi:cysteine synthase B